jgi:hypothetical protein
MKRSFARYTSTPMYPGLQPPLEMTGSSPLSLRPPLETTGSSFLCLRPPLDMTDSPAPRSSMPGIQTRRNSIAQSLFPSAVDPDPHGSEFIRLLSWIRISIGNADLGALKWTKFTNKYGFLSSLKAFLPLVWFFLPQGLHNVYFSCNY